METIIFIILLVALFHGLKKNKQKTCHHSWRETGEGSHHIA